DVRLKVVATFKKHNLLTLTCNYAFVLRIKRAFVLAPSQVRNAHAPDHSSIQLIRRERARASQDHTGHARLRQRLPKRLAFALVYNLWRRKDVFGARGRAQSFIGKVLGRAPCNRTTNDATPQISSPCER